MLPCPSHIPLPLFQMNEVCFANRAIGNLFFCWASCVPDEDKSKRTEVGLWGYRILHESNFYSEQVASTRVSYTHTNFSRLVYLVQTPSAAVFSCLSPGCLYGSPLLLPAVCSRAHLFAQAFLIQSGKSSFRSWCREKNDRCCWRCKPNQLIFSVWSF